LVPAGPSPERIEILLALRPVAPIPELRLRRQQQGKADAERGGSQKSARLEW
jgi:hypothetical protein